MINFDNNQRDCCELVGRVTPCAPDTTGNVRRARSDAPYPETFGLVTQMP